MKRRVFFILWLLSSAGRILLCCNDCFAAARFQLPDQAGIEQRLLLRIEELAGDEQENVHIEDILDYYNRFLTSPVDLNRASRADLEALLLLSPFQIESLLKYRKEGGELLSYSELSLVNGFTEELAEMLRPFTIMTVSNLSYPFQNNFRSELYMRSAIKRSQPDFLLKYSGSTGDRLSVGVTLENDAGEQYFPSLQRAFDFISLNIALKNRGALVSLVAGDFSARFGQGLILWKAFSFSSPGSPSSFYKKGAAIHPYTSSDESNFLRGVAAVVDVGRGELAAFVSYNRVDAAISENGYTALYSDGLHNTASSLKRRRTMGEIAAGGSFSYMFGSLKLSVNSISYAFDRKNGVIPKYYNEFQLYDGIWGNVSISVLGQMRNATLFGETAIDYGGALACLAGFSVRLGNGADLGAMARLYPANYIARHAGAWSASQGCYNQNGFSAGYSGYAGKKLKFELNFDGTVFPKPRYNIKGRSCIIKGNAKLIYDSGSGSGYGYVKAGYSYYSATSLSKGMPVAKIALSGTYRRNIFGWAEITVRCSNSIYSRGGSEQVTGERGYSGTAGLHLKIDAIGGRAVLHGGMTLFSVSVWANRLYIYENDLPSTFGSRVLYGKGGSYYILAQLRLLRKATLYARAGIVRSRRKGTDYRDGTIKFGLKIPIPF